MQNIFFTYNRLYPGKADIIHDAIRNASIEGENMGLSGKALNDYVESEVLDKVDP